MVKRRNPRAEEEEEEEEEETEDLPLLITTKVVEYLEPVMSEELLCKFPENSRFGFDYSQSSLWSPLVPRTIGRPLDTADSATRRDLTRELGELQEEKNSQTKQGKKKKKKKKFLGFDVSATKKKKKMKTKMAMRGKMGSGVSPANPLKVGCFGMATKGWNDMLKAASKHFKRTKKRDPIVKLSNYLKFPQI